MKKFILLFLVLVCTTFFVNAQKGYRFDQKEISIIVDGFDGNKPLKKDKKVGVQELRSDGQTILMDTFDAYKGETKEMFIKRFKETFLYQKSTPALKSQLKVKTASIGLSLGLDQKKVPTWVFHVLIGLLIFVALWGLFGEFDKDPRSMTSEEKKKFLEEMEKEKAASEKRAQKRELKNITKQLRKELNKKTVL